MPDVAVHSALTCHPWLPLWGLLLLDAALLFAALRAFALRKTRGLARRQRAALLALRLLALALLNLWLLQPARRQQSPRPEGSRIAALGDVSASMAARTDCLLPEASGARTTRLAAARHLVFDEPPPAAPLSAWRFAGMGGALHAWGAHSPETPLPGETDLGAALHALHEESRRPGAMPLRSVLLLSDGADLGGSLLDEAKEFAREGIPISTVTLGDERPPANLLVAFAADGKREFQPGKEGVLSVVLRSTLSEVRRVPVTIRDRSGAVLSQGEAEIPPGEELRLDLPLPPFAAPGQYALKAEIPTLPEDQLPNDDTAWTVVECLRPPMRKVLYLEDGPSWQWRFLLKDLRTDSTLALHALIRLQKPAKEDDEDAGEAVGREPGWEAQHPFFAYGMDATPKEFPSRLEEYAPYDAVLLPCTTANALTPSQRQALRDFVEKQGGGLLWIGDGAQVSEDLANLLPGKDFALQQTTPASSVRADGEPLVFQNGLFQRREPLPLETEYAVCLNPSRVSRVVLRDQSGRCVLLAEGNYGAGRVAWCGLSESWRWAFAGGNDLPKTQTPALHALFWRELLLWLAENRQPQLELELPQDGLVANQPNALALRVRGPDFLPAENARTTLAVLTQDNIRTVVTLLPDPQEIGRFQGEYTPEAPGVAGLLFAVETAPGATPLVQEEWLPVHAGGKELQQLAANPQLLRDVARITAGTAFQNPSSLDWEALPVSLNIPWDLQEKPLLPQSLAPVLLLATLLAEFTLRRRLGEA